MSKKDIVYDLFDNEQVSGFRDTHDPLKLGELKNHSDEIMVKTK